jgi:hypothetical protein
MTKLLAAIAVSLLTISAFADDTATVTTTREKGDRTIQKPEGAPDSLAQIKERIQQERGEWVGKVGDENAKVPEGAEVKAQMSRERADSLGRQIHAVKSDTSLTKEECQTRVKELIAAHKADAETRVKENMEKMDEFKTTHKTDIEKANADVKARIETKKVEMDAKKAEIEQRIADKKAEKEAAGTTEEIKE